MRVEVQNTRGIEKHSFLKSMVFKKCHEVAFLQQSAQLSALRQSWMSLLMHNVGEIQSVSLYHESLPPLTNVNDTSGNQPSKVAAKIMRVSLQPVIERWINYLVRN